MNHPARSRVLIRWQFAHLTSHFAISWAMASSPYPSATNTETGARFVAGSRWSNSRTLGSDSWQSMHGCPCR